MKVDVDAAIRARAKSPHDLYVLNMFLFNLPAVAGLLAYTIGRHGLLIWGVGLGLTVSAMIILYTHWRARRSEHAEHWFVHLHWRLAALRTWLLLVGYGITLVIIGAGLAIGSGLDDANMQTIMTTVFTRIGIVPALIMVLVTAILEAQAMHLVNSGIAPGAMARRFPPPEGVKVLEAAQEEA